MNKRLLIAVMATLLMSPVIMMASVKNSNMASAPTAVSVTPQSVTVSAPNAAVQPVGGNNVFTNHTRRNGGAMPVISAGQQSIGVGNVYSSGQLGKMSEPFVPQGGGMPQLGGFSSSSAHSQNNYATAASNSRVPMLMPNASFSSSKSRYTSNVTTQQDYPEATEISRHQVNSDPTIPFPDPITGEWILLLLAAATTAIRRKRK